jgi:hypothetical protein
MSAFLTAQRVEVPRTWDMKVDWLDYNADETLSPKDVNAAVKGFSDSGMNYFDTVPAP